LRVSRGRRWVRRAAISSDSRSVVASLAAAQILYGHAPEALLFTVSGGSFDCGETLTPAVAAALPDLLARIRQAVLS
jgi:hypothetical protein